MLFTIAVFAFFIFLFLGLPLGLVFGLSSLIYFASNPLFIKMLPERMYVGIDQFVLMAIPFFLLAGQIMNRSGISDKIMNFSNILIGRFRGGLAQVNVLASIIFAGITGVALGDISALGTVFIPLMEKQGYDRKFSAAVTAASSICGPIIPPSITIVLYSAIMQISVGAMFAGAIIPGILIGLSDMVIVYILAKKRNYPKVEIEITPKIFYTGLKGSILAVIMPVIIIGGILTGIFTPTEAAAVSILYAAIVGFFIFHALKIKDLIAAFKYAVYNSSKIFFLIAGGYIIAWIVGIENIKSYVEMFMLNFVHTKIVFVLAVNLLFLITGMIGETMVTIILIGPLLGSIAGQFDISLVQFGIMLVVNNAIGYLTPPVGNILYFTADLAKVSPIELSIELAPFIFANIIVVLVVGFVPELTMFLPRLFGF